MTEPCSIKKFGIPNGGRFGDSRDGGRRKHIGLDIACYGGTPIVATRASKVHKIYTTPTGGLTLELIAVNRKTVYLHLSEIKVGVGNSVKEGQVVASSGNTGRPTPTTEYGYHLHWEEYKKENNRWVPKDPLEVLKQGRKDEMITTDQQEVLYRFYLQDTVSEVGMRNIGKRTFKQEEARIKSSNRYKELVAKAKKGQLDPVKHMPAALRQSYKAPKGEAPEELKPGLYKVK